MMDLVTLRRNFILAPSPLQLALAWAIRVSKKPQLFSALGCHDNCTTLNKTHVNEGWTKFSYSSGATSKSTEEEMVLLTHSRLELQMSFELQPEDKIPNLFQCPTKFLTFSNWGRFKG